MSELLEQPATVADTQIPLCVDLDGTLVKSDTLWDSVLALVRHKPAMLLQLPLWVLKGKASFKAQVTSAVRLDTTHLPYNRPLLQYLEQQHAAGREIYLATAADLRLAERIAAEHHVFSGVLGSDGNTNLAGGNKLEAFRQKFADGRFDYIGNALPDVPLLKDSTAPMVANPHLRLRMALRSKGIKPVKEFVDQRSARKSVLKAIRLHQWAKNVLIFLPLLLAHNRNLHLLLLNFLAFLSFSLCASSTYIVNDLLDIEADRRHPKKRLRPFASGDLSIFAGLQVIGLFLAISLAITFLLPKVFLFWLAAYTASTLAYSLRLKRMVLVDVVLLSGLYTLRILAGSAATGIKISPWLASFSIFFFLSLAIVKRFSELENLRARGAAPTNGRGYLLSDIEQMRSFGTASAYASVVVFTLYINAMSDMQLYHHPKRLWLLTPILILWISRVWLLASRGQLDEDPVVFALTDRRSMLLGVLAALVVVLSL
ncbi:MAG: UbiA family prenyltransferase [Acidobacteriaceae bacterium]